METACDEARRRGCVGDRAESFVKNYIFGFISRYVARMEEEIESWSSMIVDVMLQENVTKEKALEFAFISDDIKDQVIARVNQKLSE